MHHLKVQFQYSFSFYYKVWNSIFGQLNYLALRLQLHGSDNFLRISDMVTPTFWYSGRGNAPFLVYQAQLRPFSGIPGGVTPLFMAHGYGYARFPVGHFFRQLTSGIMFLKLVHNHVTDLRCGICNTCCAINLLSVFMVLPKKNVGTNWAICASVASVRGLSAHWPMLPLL